MSNETKKPFWFAESLGRNDGLILNRRSPADIAPLREALTESNIPTGFLDEYRSFSEAERAEFQKELPMCLRELERVRKKYLRPEQRDSKIGKEEFQITFSKVLSPRVLSLLSVVLASGFRAIVDVHEQRVRIQEGRGEKSN